MNRTPETSSPPRGRRTLWLVAAVCIAPIVASYAAYYLLPAERRTNYGELLPTQAAPPLAGIDAAGRAFRLDERSRRWRLVVAAPSACDPGCARRLFATRQARAIQGKDADRVERVWLVTDGGAPDAALLGEHPGLTVVRVDPRAAANLPRGEAGIYAIDPLGNQVLAWPSDPDVKALAKDLTRLLKASRVGFAQAPTVAVEAIPRTRLPG